MDNGINSRQNTEENVEYLSAQRQIYTDSKFMSAMQFLFCILVSVILYLLIYINSNYIAGIIINFFIAFVAFVLNIFFDKLIKNQKEIAAYIQQLFDVNVFKMEWKEECFGNKKDFNYIISNKSNKYLKKHKNFDAFKCWYSKEYIEFPLNEGIYYCQKENVAWDSKLRQLNRYIYLILIISLILIIILYCTIKSKLVIDLISIMIIFSPLFQHWVTKRSQLLEDIKRIDFIKEWQLLIQNNIDKEIKLSGLYTLQKLIFENRSSCLLIYNFIYNILKRKYQDEASIHASYIRKKNKK